MSKIMFTGFVCILLGLSSCELVSPRACDLQFVSIGLEVGGGTLDKTYSIANQTDTLHTADSPLPGDLFYTVVDDSDQEFLEGMEIEVIFHGYIGDTLAVNEVFKVGADECHVYKVSGKEKVEL